MLFTAVAGPAPDAAAQADNRSLEVKVNIPYVVQFGFGSYEIGGLSVNGFQLLVSHAFRLGSEPDAWRLVLTGYPGYSHASLETRALGPKVTGSEDFAYFLPYAELQIPLWRGWTVRPYVAAGLGRTFNGSVTVAGEPSKTSKTVPSPCTPRESAPASRHGWRTFSSASAPSCRGRPMSRSESPKAKATGR